MHQPPLTAEITEVVVHALERNHPHVHLHLLVDLDRVITEQELHAALEGLVAAFPVLGCRYQPGWWRDRWVRWEGDPATRCHVEHLAAADALEGATRAWAQRPLRYLEEPPVRLAFFTLPGGAGGRLVLTLHHMVADGGGTKAAGAVLAALLCGVEPAPPPSPDRRQLMVARSLRLADLPVLAWEMLGEALLPLSILRVRALRHGMSHGSGAPDPCWVPVRLEGSAAAGLVAACKARGATINDAMVALVARMAARRAERGPVMIAYTVDLRRYLREKRAQVTNMAGVSMVVLERAATANAQAAIQAVAGAIGEQKRRFTGLPYILVPTLLIGWLPHGLLRPGGAFLIGQILRRFHRAIAVTNIGALDEVLAPFGDAARAASITGPFIHGNPVPIVTVTGFRGSFTLQVAATATHSQAELEAFATELEGLLAQTVEA